MEHKKMVNQPGIFEWKPNLKAQFNCLFCDSDDVEAREVIFQGIHILADCNCKNCGGNFFHTMPVGHDIIYPIRFDKSGKQVEYNKRPEEWLVKPLLDSIFKYPKENIALEIRQFRICKEVILVNCIDSCFGHVFTKLWNIAVLMKKYDDKGIIVILPETMTWLVPHGVAEIWGVKSQLAVLNRFLANVDKQIKNEIPRFEKIFIAHTFSHPNADNIDLKKFVKRNRFDLDQFEKLPKQIVFAVREDRLWHGSRLELKLHRVLVRTNLLSIVKWFFLKRQVYLIARFSGIIKKNFSEIKIIVTGIGISVKLPTHLADKRVNVITSEVEKEWCEIYSKSHTVIGVHGSNMLIPSYLAAGFIEILPREKIRHLAEDTVQPYNSRYSHFLGRHVDDTVSPGLLALHTLSMIRDFPYLHQNARSF